MLIVDKAQLDEDRHQLSVTLRDFIHASLENGVVVVFLKKGLMKIGCKVEDMQNRCLRQNKVSCDAKNAISVLQV